jgi:hypothetical protein
MAYLVLTCPETAHLEMIEVVQDPLGMLVQACSRFRPPHCVQCPRSCAARMDRRELGSIRAASASELDAEPTWAATAVGATRR